MECKITIQFNFTTFQICSLFAKSSVKVAQLRCISNSTSTKMFCSINSFFEQANRLKKIQLLINEIFTWELSRLFKWRIPLNSLLRGSQAASNNSPNAFCFSISRGQLLINTMTPKSFVHKSQVQLKSQFLISLEIHPVTDSVQTYNKTM